MDKITTFSNIALRIIKEQSLIIGPLAWDEAEKVDGIKIISKEKEEIILSENNLKETIDQLVAQYERLFGKLSHDICREAAQSLVKQLLFEDIPSSLR